MYANNQRTEIAFASFHFILIFLADICTPRWVHASSRRQTILRGKVQSDALLPSGYSVFYNQKKRCITPQSSVSLDGFVRRRNIFLLSLFIVLV